MTIEKKTLIVTGASRGLGAAIATIGAVMGANVVITARSTEALQAVAGQIRAAGGRVLAVAGDVSQAEDCQAVIQKTLDQFGRIDGLINNAGVIEPIARFAQANLQAWQQNWSINFLGPVMLSQMALPHLRGTHGRLVSISSGAAAHPIQGWTAYSTAKTALEHFTRILAIEEPDITALAVRPGVVDTAMQTTIRDKGKDIMAESDYGRLYGLYDKGKLVTPEESGRAIVVLSLYAPTEWSGETLVWNEERVQQLVGANS